MALENLLIFSSGVGCWPSGVQTVTCKKVFRLRFLAGILRYLNQKGRMKRTIAAGTKSPSDLMSASVEVSKIYLVGYLSYLFIALHGVMKGY